MSAKIISISGLTAGGKTTLVTALHEKLADSAIISFDDYDIDATSSAPDISQPLSENVNQYNISPILNQISKLADKFTYIILDYPFGNKHSRLSDGIDLCIYNQVPLDILLTRQIIRDHDDQGAVKWSEMYLNQLRILFISNEEFVLSSADLILDGTVPISERINTIIKRIGDLND